MGNSCIWKSIELKGKAFLNDRFHICELMLVEKEISRALPEKLGLKIKTKELTIGAFMLWVLVVAMGIRSERT